MTITRRDALKHGGKVIATAAVLPLILPINSAQAQEDAGLFALYDKYRRLEKDYGAAEAKASKAAFIVRDAFREIHNGLPPRERPSWRSSWFSWDRFLLG